MKTIDNEVALTYDDVLLVPQKTALGSRTDVDLSTELAGVPLKLPFLSAAMDTVTEGEMAQAMADLGALGVIHRFQDPGARVASAFAGSQEVTPVSIAIGLGDSLQDVRSMAANCDVLCIDVAHAHSEAILGFVRAIREDMPTAKIMVGNIATRYAALDLLNAGANILKVGIGPGAACSTREVTGHGFPNLTALMNVREAVDRWSYGKPNHYQRYVVADGGIRNSGDMAKAIAAGAHAVMMGSLLAGTDEAPGDVCDANGTPFKVYRGMASGEAQNDWKGLKNGTVAEGISGFVPYKGPVRDVIEKLAGGLRGALAMSGSATLVEFYENAEFVRVTPACLTAESKTRL